MQTDVSRLLSELGALYIENKLLNEQLAKSRQQLMELGQKLAAAEADRPKAEELKDSLLPDD